MKRNDPISMMQRREVVEILQRVWDALESLGVKHRTVLRSHNGLAKHLEKLEIQDPWVNAKQRTDYTDFELGVMAIEGSRLLQHMGDIHEQFVRLFYTKRMATERQRQNQRKADEDMSIDPPF
jgi:hypothetical protein